MTKPVPLADFRRGLLPVATLLPGLPAAIDAVAERAAPSHRFLRRGWFDAALSTYDGTAQTLVVTAGGRPQLALPLTPRGPAWLHGAAVPGCYWPFRSFPLADPGDPAVLDVALSALAAHFTVVRIGPVYDGDAAAAPLLAAARARGWATLDRFIADSYLLDITAQQRNGPWPRGTTLKKNRFHEKHLAGHGKLDWGFVTGPQWTVPVFDALADVERASWIEAETDGSDAKFTPEGHGAFWRAAAADPVLARMMWAAVLRIDGKAAAFSFDLNVGPLKYAIANSFDPAFAKHSPGKLLYYRNLVRAVQDGITVVDWGAGDSGYKRVIGALEGPAIRDWLLVRPGAMALAGRALKGVWRRSGN